LQDLWLPVLAFTNTEGNQVTVVDSSTEASVRRAGDYVLNDIRENGEKKVYAGSENPIVLHRK